MTETIKTVIYAGLALFMTVLAIATRPHLEAPNMSKEVGKPLFADLTDVGKAASFEIVKYDETLNTFNSIKVAKDKSGRWIIPDHSDYPADAQNNISDAVNSLFDLKVLDNVDNSPTNHKQFGVLESKDDKEGQPGVGTKIVLRDENNDILANLIVGKKAKAKDSGEGDGHRFVRELGRDPVYVVKFDPEKISTKFADWIEKDLLKLNAWDVKQVRLRDYLLVRTQSGAEPNHRFELTAKLDNNEWKVDSLINYSKGQPISSQLTESEELNKEKLNELKTALGDLKIVDVLPKPKGLRADLKAEKDFLNNEAAQKELASKGFIPMLVPGKNEIELASADGEVHVWVEDAVQYILRFGAKLVSPSDASVSNRLVMVTARVDDSRLPYPTLEQVPMDDAKPAQPKPEEKKDDAKSEDKQQDDSQKSDEKKADDAGDKKEDKKDEPKKEGDAKDEGKKAKDDEEVKKAELEKEKARITTENKRKIDEHNEKVKKAKDKVRDLNARFADWYYVVAEDVYKKIHLSRDDVIKESDTKAKQEGTGVDAFRELQKEGLK